MRSDSKGKVRAVFPIPAAERSSPILSPKPLAAAVAFALLGVNYAYAAPTGGQVVGGSATIQNPNATTTVIQQSTQRAALNWNSFGIAANEAVIFQQPSASAVALNRVVGPDPSQIFGTLQANGQVFLINPSGVLFARGASVDVGGLVASTLGISTPDFMAGRYVFSGGSGTGAVVNHANIRAANGGYVAFLGNQVNNTGTIAAERGTVAMAAGDTMQLDFHGDGLLTIKVDAAAANAKLQHSGMIRADGGQVFMTVRAKQALMATAINVEGIVQAKGLVERNGRIVLDGGRSGVTQVAGTLDASSTVAGQKGGDIRVLGEYVGLFGQAKLDASGMAGGGTILVGGDFQGKNADVSNAFRTYVGPNASIKADALTNGDGGKVIVWADDVTRYYGNISARGGASAGDGGFAEVSGKRILDFSGLVDTRAPHGSTGTLLLDPTDIWIALTLANAIAAKGAVFADTSADTSAGANPTVFQASGAVNDSFLSTTSLATALLTSRVLVTTANANVAATAAGNITIVDTITAPATANGLTLRADNNIVMRNGAHIDFQTLGNTGDVVLGALGGSISTLGGEIKMGGGSLLLKAATGIGVSGTPILTRNLNNFAAQTATGGVFVQNSAAGSINVTTVTPLDLAGGAVTGVTATAAGGDISLVNQVGSITVSQPISTANNATGNSGSITLTSNSGGISGAGTLTTGSASANGAAVSANATSGSISVTATGGNIQTGTMTTGTATITGADGGDVATSGSIALTSGSIGTNNVAPQPVAIGTATLGNTNTVGTLALTSTGAAAAGNIFVSSAAPLTVGNITTAAASAQTVDIRTTANSPLTFRAGVTYTGLAGNGTPASGDTLNVVTTGGTSGSVTFGTNLEAGLIGVNASGAISLGANLATSAASSGGLTLTGALTLTSAAGGVSGVGTLTTGAATANADSASSGNIVVTATGGNIKTGTITTGAATVTGPTGTDVATSGSITLSGGSIGTTTADRQSVAIGAAGGGDTNTTGSLALTSTGAGAAGNIFVGSASALTTGTVSATGASALIDIATTGASPLIVSGAMSTATVSGTDGTSGSITLSTATGDIAINSTVTTGNATPSTGTNAVSGAINVTAGTAGTPTSGNVLGTGTLTTGSATAATGADTATVGNITLIGDRIAQAATGVNRLAVSFGAATNSTQPNGNTPGKFNATSDGAGAAGDIRIGSSAALTTGTVSATAAGSSIDIQTTGVSLRVGGAMSVAAGSAGSITLAATGTGDILGSQDAAGVITSTGTGGVTLSGRKVAQLAEPVRLDLGGTGTVSVTTTGVGSDGQIGLSEKAAAGLKTSQIALTTDASVQQISIEQTGAGGIVVDGNIGNAADRMVLAGTKITGGAGTVTGGEVWLSGTNGVGTSALRVKTAAGKLQATSNVGGVFINETDAVELDGSPFGNVAADFIDPGTLVHTPFEYNLLAGGTITVTAAVSPSFGGAVTGNTTLRATAGNIVLNAAVGNGVGNVVLTSNAGNITGTGLVSGASVTLDSATGVGTGTGARVNTTATTLAARSITSGGVFVNETDAVTLGNVGSVANGAVSTVAYDVAAAGAISVTGPITDINGPVNLTATGASGSIAESGGGLINTTGTLTTSSVTGQTLNGANTVGTFNATNTTSGNIALTNTAAPLTITGISQTGGGTVTVGNTGAIAITGTVSAGSSGAVSLTSSGAISESGAGLIGTAGTLTTSSAGGTTLNGANTVGTFNATNSNSGNIQLTNTAAPLTITGISQLAPGFTVAVNNTGAIGITGTVLGQAGTTLTSTGTISESGAGLVSMIGTLTTTSVGGTTLGGSNGIFGFNATNSGSGAITLANGATPLTITGISQTAFGAVTINTGSTINITGTISGQNPGVFLTAAGTISESGAGAIGVFGTLTTSSVGGTTLNGSNGMFGFNATNTGGGNIALANAGPLTITGISQSGGGNVVVTNGSGLTVTGDVVAGAGAITLTANGTDSFLTLNAGADLASTTSVALNADQMNLAAGTIASTAGGPGKVPLVVLKSTSAGRPISIGGADAAGTLAIDQGDFNAIRAQSIRLGAADAGAITVDANVTIPTANADILHLITGSSITGTAAGITVDGLVLEAASATLTNSANNVVTLAANVTPPGAAFTYQGDTNGIIVDTLDGITGIMTNNGAVTIGSAGSLTLNQPINAGTAAVALNTNSVAQSAAGIITAGVLTGTVGTTAILDQNNAITNLGPFTTNGNFTLNDAGGLTVTGAVNSGSGLASITTSGDLSVTTGAVTGTGVTLVATGAGSDILLGGSVNAGAGALTLTASNGAGSLINQTAGTLTAGTLTGATGTTATLGQANAIANLGAFTTNGNFTLNDAGGLSVTGAVNSGPGLASITTSGDLSVTTGSVTGTGVTLTATGAGSDILLGGNVNAGTSTLTLTANNGAGSLINQTAGTLTAGTLTGTAGTTATLGQANAITNFGAFTSNGSFTLNDAGGLTVTGAVNSGAGLASITTSGDLSVTTGSVTGNGVTLVATGAGSDILLGGNVNAGAGTLTLTANNGAGSLINQTAGALTAGTLTGAAGTSATLNQAGNAVANLGAFSTDGNFTLNDAASGLTLTGPVTAGAGAVSITTAGGVLALQSSNVSGIGGVALQGAGVTSTGGTISTQAAANSGTASGPVQIIATGTGAINLAGTLNTSGADSNVATASAGGNVSLNTNSGAIAVSTVNATGGTGTAGNTNGGNAGAIVFSAGGGNTLTLGGNLNSRGGDAAGAGNAGSGTNLSIAAPTLLAANVAILTGQGVGSGTPAAGNVIFANNVNADAAANNRTLLVNAGTGTVTFQGNIGNTAPLADLDVFAGPNSIVFSGAAAQTADVSAQGGNTATFNAPVVLSQNLTVNTDGAADNNVTFGSTVNADAFANNRTLAITTGTGTATFQGGAGTTQELGGLTVAGSQLVSNGDIRVNGGGAINFINLANLSIAPGATIDTDRAGGATAGGNIVFGALTQLNPMAANATLTLDASADGGALSGNVDLGLVGNTTPLNVLIVAGDTVTFAGAVSARQVFVTANRVMTTGGGRIFAAKEFGNNTSSTNAALSLTGLSTPGIFGERNTPIEIDAPGLFVVFPNSPNSLLPVFLAGDPNKRPVYPGVDDPGARPVFYNGTAPDSPTSRAALSAITQQLRQLLDEINQAGFSKENIRRQLLQGLILETGLSRPGIDDFVGDGVTSPQACSGVVTASGALACQ